MENNNFYYESEFEEELISLISQNFSVNNSEIYMIMRFMLINNIENINKIDYTSFIHFILNENNLPQDLCYKNQSFSLFSEYSQSLLNIVKNWFFDLDKSYINNNEINNKCYIENNIKNIKNTSKKNVCKYKKTNYYNQIYLLNQLQLLNNLFNCKFIKYHKMNNLDYNLNNNKKNLEQNLLDYIEKAENLEINKTLIISEKQLEDFIKKNLNKIEDGLSLISTQYPIKNAFIDILAEDKNKNKVIIELKVKQDERLIWQTIYYPMEYLKEHKDLKNVRIITICPNYDDWLLSPLKTIDNIEIYSYKLIVENKEIKDIILKKI